MPLVTVKGIYKDGKVELSEWPAEIAETANVLAHVWGEIAFCWPGAEWISSVFRGLLSKQPQIS